MSEDLLYPSVGKCVTLVAVKDGEPLVAQAEVVLCKANLLCTKLKWEGGDLRRFVDAPVTVLYTEGEQSSVLRARVMQCVDPDRLVLSTTGLPRAGERREFIRADIDMKVRVERAPDNCQEGASAAQWASELSTDPSVWNLHEVTVDLSGSGARFNYPIELSRHSWVAISLLFPSCWTCVYHIAANVVRARPSRTGEQLMELAVVFGPMAEDLRDLLNHVVFEARMGQLGLKSGDILGDE